MRVIRWPQGTSVVANARLQARVRITLSLASHRDAVSRKTLLSLVPLPLVTVEPILVAELIELRAVVLDACLLPVEIVVRHTQGTFVDVFCGVDHMDVMLRTNCKEM